jgi:hypothetical protein
MDVDFIITSTVYLLVIIFIHMQLKPLDPDHTSPDVSVGESPDIVSPTEYSNDINETKPTIEDAYSQESYENISKESNVGLIINESELHNIQSDVANNDFMKYLSVEETDNQSTHQQLVSPLQSNTIDITKNDSKTDLDQYFANLKDEQYTFEPVPTTSTANETLYKKSVLLNKETDFDQIMAFDEFDTPYSTI